MKKYLFLSILSLFLLHTAAAQGLVIKMEADKNCNESAYCVDVLLKSSANQIYEIGTSSLLMNYNPKAMSFKDYIPAQFDPAADCGAVNGGAWEVHQYDAWSHEGAFSLVLFLSNEASDCPSRVTSQPVHVGTVCFDIIQQGGNPNLSIEQENTHFNRRTTNDGSAPIDVTSVEVVNAPELLACDCPGEGAACDDQNVYTVNDSYDLYCNCAGEYQDSDQDGILDGIDPCVDLTYEAEEANYEAAIFRNNQPQFYGNGFLDFDNNPAQFTEFTIQPPTTGDYTINIRYASNTSNRTMLLAIDGLLINDQFSFPETGTWANWQEVSLAYTFTEGPHTIYLASNGTYGPNIDRITLSICNDCELSGQDCDDFDPCTIDDVYDANCNCGGRIVDEDGDQIADACDVYVGGPEELPIEVGLVKEVGDDWQTVNLEQSFESMVVVATPLLPNSSALPVVSRIRNASGNSFEVKIQNPNGPVLADYAVYYVAVEEGVYREEYDGISMEARKEKAEVTADKNAWSQMELRSYQQTYDQPVVIGQVMSEINMDWSVFWSSSETNYKKPPTNQGYAAGKHKGEDLNTSREEEQIGIIIIEEGIYQIRNKVLEAAIGPNSIGGLTSSGHDYDLTSSVLRGAVLSCSGIRGNNGYWPVLFGATPVGETKMIMVADEDQASDVERSHVKESIAYLAFEEIICLLDTDGDNICDEDDICPGHDDLADVDSDGLPDGCDPCDDRLIGRPCNDGQECTILDVFTPDCGCAGIPFDSDNDGVCNWEDLCDGADDNIDVDADGIPDACDPNIGDATTMPIETGIISNVGNAWQPIILEKSYDAMVVVATVQLTNDELPPVVTRIRNAEGNSFELKVQNPSELTTEAYTVYYFVVEEGVYQQEFDGVSMEARRVSSSTNAYVGGFSNRESRTYMQSYTNPVVLGQVMSAEDDRWSVFWSSEGTSTTSPPSALSIAAGKHIGGDTIADRSVETLGLIILESGQYNLRGIDIEANVGADIVLGIDNTNTGYQYPLSLANPTGAILSATGMDGGDGCWPVLFGDAPFVNSELTLVVDEDQISDTERAHIDEQVAYLAFDDSGAIPMPLLIENPEGTSMPTNPIQTPENNASNKEESIVLYPNPAYNMLTLEASVAKGDSRRLLITDISGQTVLAQALLREDNHFIKHEINISQLSPGTYFLQLLIGEERQVVPFVIAR